MPQANTGSKVVLNKLEPEGTVRLPSNVMEVRRKTMNATAYRIFKTLQWLIEGPLSVDALNQKFLQDSFIGKQVSSDSIWLYVNTLKQLGCEIRRPSPKTGFCYELTYHPFGFQLLPADLEVLAVSKLFAQQVMSHQEILQLDKFYKKIVAGSSKLEGELDRAEAIERLFTESRSFDYQPKATQIQAMEQWAADTTLLELVYLSPLKGAESFLFLPEALFYEQGVLYVRGDRPDYSEPSLLRLDRIESAMPLEEEALERVPENADIKTQLLAKRTQVYGVELLLMAPSTEPLENLGFVDACFELESQVWQENTGWRVTLRTRHLFRLKQRLLSCGFLFQVLAPTVLKEVLIQDLQQTLAYYQEDGYGDVPVASE